MLSYQLLVYCLPGNMWVPDRSIDGELVYDLNPVRTSTRCPHHALRPFLQTCKGAACDANAKECTAHMLTCARETAKMQHVVRSTKSRKKI